MEETIYDLTRRGVIITNFDANKEEFEGFLH